MSRFGVVVIALLLGACASNSPAENAVPSAPLFSPEAMATVPASALGPQTLLPGECALFLWSKTDPSKFIFFSKATTGTALISQSAGPIDLVQTGAGGDIFGQFTTSQTFAAVNGTTVQVELVPGDQLDGGQRVQSGMITTRIEGDWLTKQPILGVRACQPD